MSQNWEEDSKQEEGNDQDKGEDNLPVCSDWDVDLEEQDRKNQEIKDQKTIEGKTPQDSPTSLSATLFTLHSPESSFGQSTKKLGEISTEEKKTWDPHSDNRTWKFKKTLEEID